MSMEAGVCDRRKLTVMGCKFWCPRKRMYFLGDGYTGASKSRYGKLGHIGSISIHSIVGLKMFVPAEQIRCSSKICGLLGALRYRFEIQGKQHLWTCLVGILVSLKKNMGMMSNGTLYKCESLVSSDMLIFR